jgi:hypothetical protein
MVFKLGELSIAIEHPKQTEHTQLPDNKTSVLIPVMRHDRELNVLTF